MESCLNDKIGFVLRSQWLLRQMRERGGRHVAANSVGEIRSLLVMRDSSHVQGQGHDIVSGVRWLNAQGDSLASEPHDGQLHAKCCDVHCAARFRGSRPLLARRGSPHVLGRSLDLVSGVRWLDPR